jgi:hypothetical protein
MDFNVLVAIFVVINIIAAIFKKRQKKLREDLLKVQKAQQKKAEESEDTGEQEEETAAGPVSLFDFFEKLQSGEGPERAEAVPLPRQPIIQKMAIREERPSSVKDPDASMRTYPEPAVIPQSEAPVPDTKQNAPLFTKHACSKRRMLFKNRSDIRRSIILTEVLGKPLAERSSRRIIER